MNRPIAVASLMVLACAGLAACAPSGFRYQPEPQPAWTHLYADYSALSGSVDIVVSTDKRRLESAYIQLADKQVPPVRITYPNFAPSGSVGIGTGVGVGGGHVGTGVGVGAGIPVGPEEPQGPTIVNFDAAAIGPPPWMFHVKVTGVEDTVIRVGGAPNVK